MPWKRHGRKHIITVRKGAADTALTCTIAASGGAGVYYDRTHKATFAQGDFLSISLVNAAGGTSAVITGISFEVVKS